MVTGADCRRSFARNAIACFLAQTHPNRFLLVVNYGRFAFEVPGVPASRVIQVQLRRRKVLGALRNHALRLVPKDAIILQWDDDDWRAPRLIEDQLRAMEKNGADGCALGRQVKYSLPLDCAWEDTLDPDFRGFAGTIMFRNKADMRYPRWPQHEDSAFWAMFMVKYPVCRWDNPHRYYVRFIHGHNTSDHLRSIERPRGQWLLSPRSRAYLRTVLTRYG